MKHGKNIIKWALMLALTAVAGTAMAQAPFPKIGNDTVCVGATKSYGVVPTTGSSYSWSVTSGTSGTDWSMPPSTSNTVAIQWLKPGTYPVQVIEKNSSNCFGDPVTINVVVYATLTAGTASADQTICYNTAPAAITATAATGGDGAYTYQWQVSTDGGTTWTDITGATALTYTPGALTQTTKYRLKQTSGTCGTVNTNNVTITVQANLTAGTASADQTICYNTAPAVITATAATGGTGAYTYQWQVSTDGGTTWTDITGATGLSYTPGALTQTTKYRLKQTSGTCGTVNTNNVTITVQGNLTAGTASADQAICVGNTPAAITATAATGGTGAYTYQWEASTDGGTTWTDVAGATGLSYTPGALTQTTVYRLKQTSGSCGTVRTNNVTITVNPKPNTSPIYHN